MSYHIHQKDPESYSNSNEPWARTDLPTSTPVGGFDTSAYPYDHSLLSADAALWSTPEFMMPPFFPDGGDIPYFEGFPHFIPTTHWPEYDANVSQNNSPFRHVELSDQQPEMAALPGANYCSSSPFTTGSTMSTASGSSSDVSTFSATGSSTLPHMAAAIMHPAPLPSNTHTLLPQQQRQQPFHRGYDIINSDVNREQDSSAGLTEEQLLDAAITAETHRQSALSASLASSVSGTDSSKSLTSLPSRPLLFTATTIKSAPSAKKTPVGDDNANLETDPALIPRAYMRPNAVRASQACVACRKRKVRCVPLTDPPLSSTTASSSSGGGPWRKAREDGADVIAGRCCRRCAKIGIECLWAKERRGKRSTTESSAPTTTTMPVTDGGQSTSSTAGRPFISATSDSRSPVYDVFIPSSVVTPEMIKAYYRSVGNVPLSTSGPSLGGSNTAPLPQQHP